MDIGNFHFVPGQPAPVHTHVAPVFGYVSQGTIYFQVEGQKPQTLKTGDAFYEPVGPRMLHSDNALETDKAVFTDIDVTEQTMQPAAVTERTPSNSTVFYVAGGDVSLQLEGE